LQLQSRRGNDEVHWSCYTVCTKPVDLVEISFDHAVAFIQLRRLLQCGERAIGIRNVEAYTVSRYGLSDTWDSI